LRQVHDLTPGTPAWDEFRLVHGGASEAAAMLGLSTKVKRSELLRMKHTGMAKEFSAWVQENILDHGHEVEALARPHVEAMIDADLYAMTLSDGYPSCTTDGQTIDDTIAWEHKQFNAALFASVQAGIVPEEHLPQCMQVLMVGGAGKLIFTVSDGTPERMAHVTVFPSEEWFKRIRAGWAQFQEDLANYVPPIVTPTPVAAVIEQLPALVVNVEGRVVASNLEAFRGAASTFLAGIKTNLDTDQDFADAEKTVKFCADGEERLELVKAQALSQTSTIDELFRTIDFIKEEMRQKRLTLEKLVKGRKESIRFERVQAAQDVLLSHIDMLNKRLGANWLPRAQASFVEAIKNKRTIASLQDAIDGVVASTKIELNAKADTLDINRKSLVHDGVDYFFLFADFASAGLKPAEDFQAIASARIGKHQDDEKAREAAKAVAPPAPAVAAAPAPIYAPDAKQPAPTPTDEVATLNVGAINAWLAPIKVDAAGLVLLGITHSDIDKTAKLYRKSDCTRIRAALIRHIQALS